MSILTIFLLGAILVVTVLDVLFIAGLKAEMFEIRIKLDSLERSLKVRNISEKGMRQFRESQYNP